MLTFEWGARRAALVVSSCLAVVLSGCSNSQNALPKMPQLKSLNRQAVGGTTPYAGTAQFDAPGVDVNTWTGTPMGTGGFSVAASPTLTGGPLSVAAEDTSTAGNQQYFVVIGDFYATTGTGLAVVSAAPFTLGTTPLGGSLQVIVFDWATGDTLAQAQAGSLSLTAAGTQPGQRVTGSLTASFVLVTQPGCVVDADCAAGEQCVSGQCVAAPPACVVDADCPRGQQCAAGQCVSPPPACLTDADCAAGQQCVSGQCVSAPQCVVDADCNPGEVCAGGTCVSIPPPQCVVDADCNPGESCVRGTCVSTPPPQCVVDADCNRGDVCRAGACVPGTPGSCIGRQGSGSVAGSSGGVAACTPTGSGAISLTGAPAFIDSDSGQLYLAIVDGSGAQRGLVIILNACPSGPGTVQLNAGDAQLYDEQYVGTDTALYTVKMNSGGSVTFTQAGASLVGSFSVDFQGGATVTGSFSL